MSFPFRNMLYHVITSVILISKRNLMVHNMDSKNVEFCQKPFPNQCFLHLSQINSNFRIFLQYVSILLFLISVVSSKSREEIERNETGDEGQKERERD